MTSGSRCAMKPHWCPCKRIWPSGSPACWVRYVIFYPFYLFILISTVDQLQLTVTSSVNHIWWKLCFYLSYTRVCECAQTASPSRRGKYWHTIDVNLLCNWIRMQPFPSSSQSSTEKEVTPYFIRLHYMNIYCLRLHNGSVRKLKLSRNCLLLNVLFSVILWRNEGTY